MRSVGLFLRSLEAVISQRTCAQGLGEVLRAHPDDMRRSEVVQHAELYSQTLTAISIFKYVNIVCIIQVHMGIRGVTPKQRLAAPCFVLPPKLIVFTGPKL